MNKLKVESTMRSINGFTIDFDLFLDKSNKDMHVSVNKEVVKKNMLLTSINTQGNKKEKKELLISLRKMMYFLSMNSKLDILMIHGILIMQIIC